MACEFCGGDASGPCRTPAEAHGCLSYPWRGKHAAATAKVAVIRADQEAEAWRRENTPMAKPRTRRMMLTVPPVRRFGLPSERIYFAHPMPDYDTLREAEAIRAIQDHFGPEFDVVNPNHPDHRAGYAASGNDFKYWTDLAASCGMVVYMSLPEGWIGSGVWKEAEAALLAGRWVHEIDRGLGRIVRVRHLDVSRCLSVDETRRTTHMILQYRKDYGNG
jgi:hypothetical protein